MDPMELCCLFNLPNDIIPGEIESKWEAKVIDKEAKRGPLPVLT